ncbi:MAG: permease-like cell division protein FtsX [Clostridiales bacterium]|nr:permease-like cell division protein FtsX [Clostridiales bacterium]
MSIRAFFNSVREGFRGIIRHPLVTVASVTTILLMLIIMSVFVIFSLNARNMMNKLSQRPPIEVYMKLQCTEEQRNTVNEVLKGDERILSYSMSTPEENYYSYKENLGDSASVLDDFDYNSFLPYTFNIRLVDPADADDVCNLVGMYDGVYRVAQESRVMQFLTNASNVVRITTVVAFIVLFVISLFIISNMVRISVYSRSVEIEIMKFIGATNNYIRLPYIIEGAIVGLISALCAWGITSIVYHQIYANAMRQISTSSFYALLPTSRIIWAALAVAVIMGVLIGSVGSGISVRKYVKV